MYDSDERQYYLLTVQPGTAMTVKEMGPASATGWAFFCCRRVAKILGLVMTIRNELARLATARPWFRGVLKPSTKREILAMARDERGRGSFGGIWQKQTTHRRLVGAP